MNPAILKDKVTFRKLSQTVDNEGTVIDSYTDSFNRFAQVRPARGREPYINDQFLDIIDFVVSVRFDGQTRALDGKYELIYKGQRLRIEGYPVNVENQDKELRMFCTRYANDR